MDLLLFMGKMVVVDREFYHYVGRWCGTDGFIGKEINYMNESFF
jgi:hypothetical protein